MADDTSGWFHAGLGAATAAIIATVLRFALRWRRGSWESLVDLNNRLGLRIDDVERALAECEKHHADALRKYSDLEARFSSLGSIQRLASTAIIVADEDGVIRDANAPAGLLFHTIVENIIGTPLVNLVPEQLRERHLKGFARLKRANYRLPDRTIVARALRFDGQEFAIEVRLRDAWVDGPTGKRFVAAEGHEVFETFGNGD